MLVETKGLTSPQHVLNLRTFPRLQAKYRKLRQRPILGVPRPADHKVHLSASAKSTKNIRLKLQGGAELLTRARRSYGPFPKRKSYRVRDAFPLVNICKVYTRAAGNAG